MADKGYVSRLMLKVPYDDPELIDPQLMEKEKECRVQYNDGIKKGRILIERVNARLKNRFTYLKGMRLQVRLASGDENGHQDFKAVNDVAVACFVLYNFMVDHHDIWENAAPLVADSWVNVHQKLQGKQARALARASALAQFSLREQELASRELSVQQYAAFLSSAPPLQPFWMD